MQSFKMISLFTGAGGLDYGFEAAGFMTCVAVEIDHDCCATLKKNRLWPVIEKDIKETTIKEILEVGDLEVGETDLLIGGPPCQPFSKSGYWMNGDTKRINDPRAKTLDEYMRCVADLIPKVFVLENVHGINYSGKEEGFRLLQRLTENINRDYGTDYLLNWRVLDTADYGVPQHRKRFFLIAQRDGKLFEFPPPTHGPDNQNNNQLLTSSSKRHKSYVTAWDAIGGLKDDFKNEDLKVHGKWADLLPSIPEGENYLWHTNRKGGLNLFGWRTRYWSFLLKLAKNLPSWTIQAQPGPAIGPFHWKNRRLSVKEMASLQTFPNNIEFVGNRNSVQKQIGNAVPSLMAEILAREIAKQFFTVEIKGEFKFAVKLNRPIPKSEPVKPVPKKYWSLIGDHPDHP